MACTYRKQCAGEAAWIPVGHGEAATWDEDAGELGGDELGSWSEHGAEHADDRVEACVGVRHRFRIALVERDFETFGGGAGPSLREEVGGDVDAGDNTTQTGERNRGVAGAAGHIEHTGPGRKSQAVRKEFGAWDDRAGDLAEISGHPRGAHGGFDLIDRGYRGGHEGSRCCKWGQVWLSGVGASTPFVPKRTR